MTWTDRCVHLLGATMVLLGLLLLWQHYHGTSCAALAFPVLIYTATSGALVAHRLERRRFAVDYYLNGRSSWRRPLSGRSLPVLVGMVAAVPLTAFLVVFVALARSADWWFLASAALLAPPLFAALSGLIRRHLRGDVRVAGRGVSVADVLTIRLAGRILFTCIALVFVFLNYMWIGGPWHIYPDSLQLTVDAFTSRVHSSCPAVHDGLRAAAAVEGISWYLVTASSSVPWMTDGLRVIVWGGFFLNAALAMAGLVRGLEGVMLAANRVVGWRNGAVYVRRMRERP